LIKSVVMKMTIKQMSLAAKICFLLCALSIAQVGFSDEESATEVADKPAVPELAKKTYPRKFKKPVLIRMEGTIWSKTEFSLRRRLAQAKALGADVVIIEIDSPGGYVESGLNIADMIGDVDWAHTVAFVPKDAISAATFVAQSCKEIIMDDQALIGDAGLIDLGGNYAEEKFTTATVAEMRSTAEKAGHSPAFAEAMIDKDVQIYAATNATTGELKYVTEDGFALLKPKGHWEKGAMVPESREGRFFEVTGRRAMELGLVSDTATGRASLQRVLELDEEPQLLIPNWVDTTVYWLNSYFVTFLLITIGLIALLVEFSAPGISIGGLISGLCFTLFFWGQFAGGTGEWLDVVLFLAGVVFVGVEIFVLPGFGVAGVSGLLLMFVSVLLATQDFVVPDSGSDWMSLLMVTCIVMGSGITVFAAAVMISYFYGEIPVLGQLALSPPAAQASESSLTSKEKDAVAAGVVIEPGQFGRTSGPLRPTGKAMFNDELHDVVSEGEFIDSDQLVKVIKVSGNRIIVREADEETG
jgi:membrane-bound serine protease (ClpP class)